ncbi:metallophosphoesterase family protein [Pararhodonellum marinum]|uniref:metallophosphoesterase family protein n=1 Tax=Pararhodonellum marinum TaxID=2755358 RepID=UPI001E46A08E|nr:metallophosphoesterase [Pararhodonellum marinum]
MKNPRRKFIKEATFFSAATLLGGMTQLSAKSVNQVLDYPFTGANLKLKIIVASDGHFGQPDTDYVKMHEEFIKDVNGLKGIDLVVFNGDLIHDEPALIPQVKTYYDQLQVPYLTNKGNHDRISPTAWESTWGYPENHAREMNGVGLIFGSTSNEKGDYLCADVDWLEEQVHRFKDLSTVLIFLHISQKDWTRHAVNCPDVMERLSKFDNLKAVFHGHDHDIDGLMYSGSKPYLFSGHMGGSWGTPHRGYRVVEVYEEGKVLSYLQTVLEHQIINLFQMG